MIEQIKALENGMGIQFLLHSAYNIIKNPIYMIDINYNLISITDFPADDPNWNELVTTGTFSMRTLELLADEGIFENIANSEKSVILKNDKLKYAKMSGHIFNRDNIRIGLATMIECGAKFDDECMAAFEALTDKITGEIREDSYFTMLGMTFYEDRINLLLDGAIKNTLLYNHHVQVLYDGFEDYLYVDVLSVERNKILEHVHKKRLKYFQSFLKTRYPSFKYSIYADNIVMLMSSKNNTFYGAPLFFSNAGLFEQNGMFMGISDSFENMYELRRYYDQAVTALKKGREGAVGQRIFLHADTR